MNAQSPRSPRLVRARRTSATTAAGLLMAVCVAATATPTEVAGQGTIAERVSAVRDGTVRLHFEAKPGVCGTGRGWSRTDRDETQNGRTRDVELECEPGPVRLVIERRAGTTVDLRTYVGGRWSTPDAQVTDVGAVAADEAVRWLLEVAEGGEEAVAKDAIAPLTIAATDVPWPRVMAIARDVSRPRAVRTQAMFWAAQEAGDRAAQELGVIARTDADAEVRTQAVFALSRRADGVDQLIRVARESKDREVKRSAYFWLGQSRDPRAAELLAEVLARP